MKTELRIRNVTHPSRLKKPDLFKRLKESLHPPVVPNGDDCKKKKKGTKKPKADDMSEFAPGAHWRVLKPSDTVVEEPANPSYAGPVRAPTVPEEDADKPVKPKFNFPDKLKRPAFKGKSSHPLKDSSGNVAKDADGNVQCPTRTRGEAKASFLERHKLAKDSHPSEFFDAFFPLKMNPHKNSSNQPHFSISQAQQWTNVKAMLSNAGSDDCHPDFKPFALKETQQHLGGHTPNGLSPSPTIDLKFDRSDEANYNYFVDSNIPNGVRRHRHFRAFFSVQDPRKETPPRGTSPPFEVLPLINWLNRVGQVSWNLSIGMSLDEQTIGFKGRHFQKLRIACKAEGDGFQCDATCDGGFTHSVHFRNEKPPRRCTRMGSSPLVAGCMWLFDRIEDECTRAWMDNLCISAKFAKFAFNHIRKVLIAGVARKNGGGIPLSVLQEEQKDKTKILQHRGTVKAAVLEDDPEMSELISLSVHDTKPVHFISTFCEETTWVRRTKPTWSEAKQQMGKINFLRLNFNDDCNKDMGSVDVADQLRNCHRFDHWLRNWKWWFYRRCQSSHQALRV